MANTSKAGAGFRDKHGSGPGSCADLSDPLLDDVSTPLVYDLRAGESGSDNFYLTLAAFTDRVLSFIRRRSGHNAQVTLGESDGGSNGFELGLLTAGTMLRQYLGAAEQTPSWAAALARALFRLRNKLVWIKPPADLGRAILIRYFLAPYKCSAAKPGALTPRRFSLLIRWMEATGEFEQVVLRLKKWRSFLDPMSRDDRESRLRASIEIAEWFEAAASEALGKYTPGVEQFLSGEYARRGLREDRIFCGSRVVEYHLAMVASEIMNRELRPGFAKTARRVVLLPACMRRKSASECHARVSGVDISCAACDSGCAINRITRKMREQNVVVYIVPHSTGFSRWLERWQSEPDTGVLAAACMLNILPGGYEMQSRHIASQCVPLDYPGCAKHWRKTALSTRLNEERLVRITANQGSV